VRLAGPVRPGLAGAVAAVGLAGCAGATRSVNHTATGEKLSIAQNQLVLTPAESRRLVRWLTRMRACLQARGIEVGQLHVTRKQLTLPVEPTLGRRALVRHGVACGEKLGGPARRSSLQAFRGRLILYLPRACILDPKVARQAAGT
jgi:hypothetical protein